MAAAAAGKKESTSLSLSLEVNAASRPESPIRPQVRQLTGYKVLRQTRNSCIVHLGKWWEQEAASFMLGQLLTSAEIEEVRELSCGALDPEFDAEEDAAREMYFQSDL